MTSETTTDLPPADVLEMARSFFTGPEAIHEMSISESSDTHVEFASFRSSLVVAAFPDPEEEGRTRVRVSTLREYGAADQFLTFVRTASEKVEASAPGEEERRPA